MRGIKSICADRPTTDRAEHARLLKHVASEIDHLATDMGFSARLIATREFRAERADGHIVRIVTE